MSDRDSNRKLNRREFLKIWASFSASVALRPRGESVSMDEKEFIALYEVSHGDTSRKVVLMTYDDFNSHANIETILDAYRDHGLKTSFFFPAGYFRNSLTIDKFGKEIERIVDEGHVFGCHGLVNDPYTTLDSGVIRKDIESWLDIVSDIIPGYKVKWARFPFGDRNDRTRSVFAEYGLQSVMWSLESGGEDGKTYERVTSGIKKGDIVLSHTIRHFDTQDSSRILDYLQKNNFSVESVETGLNPSDYFPKSSVEPKRYNLTKSRAK